MITARLIRLAAIASLCGLGSCTSAPDAPVRVHYTATLANRETEIGKRLEDGALFKKRGVNAVVEGSPLFQQKNRQWEEYDVLIGAETFPAVMIASGYRGKIVATLGTSGEFCILASPTLSAKRAADLKGKTVVTMMGNALHLYLLNWLRAGKVDPSEVRIVPQGRQGFSVESLLQDRSPRAYASWSPLSEILITQGGWRRLAGPRGSNFTTVLMSERLLKRPAQAQAVLLALLDAASGPSQDPRGIDLSPDQEPFWTALQSTRRLRREGPAEDIVDPGPLRQAQQRWRSERR